MNKLLGVIALALCTLPAVAGGEKPAPAKPDQIRELYVPYDDLNVILQAGSRRVFLSREKYVQLQEKASQTPDPAAPVDAMVVSADYKITVETDRARISGTLQIDLLTGGMQAMQQPLHGVGVTRATLDGQPAALARVDEKSIRFFLAGKGRHTLDLEMVTPLVTSSAEQSLTFLLPSSRAVQMELTVPGNVEIKRGAQVISRVYDEEAQVTRFELSPARGEITLVMSLNNRLLQTERIVIARSVCVDEMTRSYERLYVTMALNILHGATSNFRFAVPAGFEIVTVKSPLLSQWNVVSNGAAPVLDVQLREPATETVVLNVFAERTPAPLKDWSLPELRPLHVAEHVAAIGLFVEDRLETQNLTPKGLLPIDTAVLTRALPPALFAADPGAPPLEPVAAYYAPHADHGLSAQFQPVATERFVDSDLLLSLSDEGQGLSGKLEIFSLGDILLELDLITPPGWHLTALRGVDGTDIHRERYVTDDGQFRWHVVLSDAMPPGASVQLDLTAEHIPADWLSDWQATVGRIWICRRRAERAGASGTP